MKPAKKAKWSHVTLTNQGRSKLRTAIREHPAAAQYVRSGSEVSALSKAGLLDLAAKLGIDHAAVLLAPADQYSEIGSPEAATGAFAPEPFAGDITFEFAMDFLGKKVTRQARIRYTHRPDWVYFDTKAGREVVPPIGVGGSYSFEVQSVAETEIFYSGEDVVKRGRTVRKRLETAWEPCNDLTEIGIWSDEMWDAIFERIDQDCRTQDQANRARVSPVATTVAAGAA